MTLRPATAADADLLRRWDREPHVIAAKTAEDWQWESELKIRRDWREQYIAEVEGRPIGFLQIMDPEREGRYWGCIEPGHRAIDIWIGDPADRNKGLGAAMMRAVIDRCFSDPTVTAIVIDPLNSNAGAHRFYQRLGFKIVGRRMFGEDDCLVHRLERRDWEQAHGS